MKAYKVEVLIIDFDEVGMPGIAQVLENGNYPNRCISPMVMSTQMRDIGEWTDEHPLNKRSTKLAAYQELFGRKDA